MKISTKIRIEALKRIKMNNYYWSTENPHSTNLETMRDFINNHISEHFEVVLEDGSYIEIQNDEGVLYGVHASGNGDFYNHIVRFELLTPKKALKTN